LYGQLGRDKPSISPVWRWAFALFRKFYGEPIQLSFDRPESRYQSLEAGSLPILSPKMNLRLPATARDPDRQMQ
jgi:hypothetical protein